MSSAPSRFLLSLLSSAMVWQTAFAAKVVFAGLEDEHAHEEEEEESTEVWEKWVYSILATLIVSVGSMIGIIAFLARKSTTLRLTLPLMGFAAGTLLSTASFILLHETAETIGFEGPAAALLLSGFALGFIVDSILTFTLGGHSHSHVGEQENAPKIDGKKSEMELELQNTSVKEEAESSAERSNSEIKIGNKPSSGYNVIIADGIHNFIDGILIGVTFGTSVRTGFLTTLAILFHEIPQEISDFQVLLQAGFSVKKALLVNFLSALTAVVGAIVGAGAGESAEEFANYCLPFAAGMFVYIAAVEIVPQTLVASNTVRKRVEVFFAALVGVVLIFAVTQVPEEWGHSHEEHAH